MGTPQDKLQIADEIGRLESQLAQAESSLREKERKLQSAKGNRVAGAAALLIGLILMLFFGGIIGILGIFLIVIGVLAWITAIFKQSGAKNELKMEEARIADLRGKLAELRAQAAMGATSPPLPSSVQESKQPVKERLAELSGLKDNGLIDQEEYAKKRQQILDEV
jgi:hypothetical protein